MNFQTGVRWLRPGVSATHPTQNPGTGYLVWGLLMSASSLALSCLKGAPVVPDSSLPLPDTTPSERSGQGTSAATRRRPPFQLEDVSSIASLFLAPHRLLAHTNAICPPSHVQPT